MVQQMGNQNESDKISASYIPHETYKFPASYHQQYANTSSNGSKILGFIPRPKTDMAETCQNKASEIKLKTTRNVRAFGP
jgi:peptide methionine sulfoxide reductase MsrA